MGNQRGTPWQPDRLDDLLEKPFSELEHVQEQHILVRLDNLYAQLQQIEDELDTLIDERAPVAQ